jgi:hypothetical protein
MTSTISNHDDVIDSRDVMARIEELEALEGDDENPMRTMAYEAIEVAKDSLASVNAAWREFLQINLNDCNCAFDDQEFTESELLDRDNHDHKCWFTRAVEECEIYLYVRPNGHWVIDHAQYFQGGRVSSAVGIYHYESAEDLCDAIENGHADCDVDDDEESLEA